jgi:hypothetical protein
MADDPHAKLILLAMLAVMGVIGTAGLLTALRTGIATRRRTTIDRAADPDGFRRAIAARAMLLGFLALAFVAIFLFG